MGQNQREGEEKGQEWNDHTEINFYFVSVTTVKSSNYTLPPSWEITVRNI